MRAPMRAPMRGPMPGPIDAGPMPGPMLGPMLGRSRGQRGPTGDAPASCCGLSVQPRSGELDPFLTKPLS
jgi:hypothetical protein